VFTSCVVGVGLRIFTGTLGSHIDRVAQLVLLCVALPLNDAFCRTPLQIALKRIIAVEYAGNALLETQRRDQFIAFFYVLHNIGDIVANGVYYRWRLAPAGVLAANANVLYLSAVILASAALAILWMRWLAPRADRPLVTLQKETSYMHTVQKAQFWRYIGVVLILTCIKSMFLHFDLTLTKHLIVELGPYSPFPLLQSINPCIVVVLTPFMPWLFQRLRVATFDILILGTTLSALGCLAIGLLQLCASLQTAYAVGLVLFSLGEAVWGPRLAAYALEIAPDGFEAAYQSWSGLPDLLLIFIGPLMSKALITNYCTSTHCNGTAIWSILGLVAAASPLALTGMRSWLKD
jgi:hypothetical protein